MDFHEGLIRVLRATSTDVAALLADDQPYSSDRAQAGRGRRLILLRPDAPGPPPAFCSYRNRRGKRCEQIARWRELDGVLGYCTAHRASAGLDDPVA